MSEWQSIETAPKDGTRILLWFASPRHPTLHRAVTGYWHKSLEAWDIGTSVVGNVTHWMPLPAPPKQKTAPKKKNVSR